MYLATLATITEFKAKAGEAGPEVTITVKAKMAGDDLAELSESLGGTVNLELSSIQRGLFDTPIKRQATAEPTPIEEAAAEPACKATLVCEECGTVLPLDPNLGDDLPEVCAECGGHLRFGPDIEAKVKECVEADRYCPDCAHAGDCPEVLQVARVASKVLDEPEQPEQVNEGDTAARYVCSGCGAVKAFGPGETVPAVCPDCGSDLRTPDEAAQACIQAGDLCDVCEAAGVKCNEVVKAAKYALEAAADSLASDQTEADAVAS